MKRPGLPLSGVLALLVLAGSSFSQDEIKRLGPGDLLPALTCVDANQKKLDWSLWGDRAVIIFFHSENISYSDRGLRELLVDLKKETQLRESAAILVVTSGKRELGALSKSLEASGFPYAVTIDPDRTHFLQYHVVAFPTVYVADRNHKVVSVDKGYGPLLSLKIITGAKLAASLISKEAYQEALSSGSAPVSKSRLKLARSVRMAKQLFAAGMVEQARSTLLKVVDDKTEYPDALSLLARLYLNDKEPDQAKKWIARFSKARPGSVTSHKLRAILALVERKPEAAMKEIAGVNAKDPEIALIKGRALEMTGKFKEAAEVYREALESALHHMR